MQIIGITGTNSAGKGTIVNILKEDFDFEHFSVREYLTEQLRSRGLDINRENMRDLANNLREKYGPGYIVTELYKKAKETKTASVIESIRCVGEVEELRKLPEFTLIGVDADPKIRYKRAVLRGTETDKLSFEDFISIEKTEMESDDKGKQNLKKCIQISDIVFLNNGTIEELEDKVKEYLTY